MILNDRSTLSWACLFLLAGGFLLAARAVRQDVRDFYGRQPVGWEVKLSEWPEYLDLMPFVEEELGVLPLSPADFGLFDEGISKRLRDFLSRQPWVLRVRSLEIDAAARTHPGEVRFAVELRTPVAVVRQRQELYLTDGEGVLLGGPVPEVRAREFGLAVIESPGLSFTPPVRWGTRWPDPEVAEAAAVARLLSRHRIQDLPVRIIGIETHRGDPRGAEIVLLTDDGRRIEWGRSPAAVGLRLRKDREKVRALEEVLADRDMVRFPYWILSLQFGHPVGRRLIGSELRA